MKPFLIVWIVLFLLAVIPVIKLDARLARIAAWNRLTTSIIALGKTFERLNVASGDAAKAMQKFTAVMEKVHK